VLFLPPSFPPSGAGAAARGGRRRAWTKGRFPPTARGGSRYLARNTGGSPSFPPSFPPAVSVSLLLPSAATPNTSTAAAAVPAASPPPLLAINGRCILGSKEEEAREGKDARSTSFSSSSNTNPSTTSLLLTVSWALRRGGGGGREGGREGRWGRGGGIPAPAARKEAPYGGALTDRKLFWSSSFTSSLLLFF
jgi:hypothetical protein